MQSPKLSPITRDPTSVQTRHLIATAVERVVVLGGVHLVLVRQALEVSAFGRCSARLLREQVVVERHLVQRAGVGDAVVPAGWHLVDVHDGGAVEVAALDGLQRESQTVLNRGWPRDQCRARHGRWVPGG
eukprot:scaffold7987_cov77-Phaeocystis_antarctica.AAC.1